ncbi:MAG: hypothetical protein D6714_01075 [Bacteroidetes bacterium]|nr:MAG: hypothetical protein D6714_01075 [Bacteroidota bacterium]
MNRIYFFLGLLLWSGGAWAQINPPEFICVINDTLFWNPPVNNCGPFVSYQVFVSDSADGPFTLLTEIADETATSFYPGNQGSTVQFYYLLSNYNCPGETPIPSDTLDNRQPDISRIQSASVENGQVQLSWYPSPSPEVIAYIIYRQTDIGVIPVDTVYSTNVYIDPVATPDQNSESYFVNALDACGNTSIFDQPHQTIFLQTTELPCEQSVRLSWSPYKNWVNGVEKYEIRASENGNTPFLVGTTDGADTTFLFENAPDQTEVCFTVRAIEQNTGVISNSNEVCMTLDVIEPVEYLVIKNVSYDEFNGIEVVWEWNPNAEITDFTVFRSDDNVHFEPIATQTITFPLDPQDTFFDNTINPSVERYFYKIATTDICGNIVESNIGPTIFLNGKAQSNQINQLFWTPLNLDNLINIQYEIHKVVGNSESIIAQYFGLPVPHLDHIDPSAIEESRSCYFIVATSEFINPVTGEKDIIRTRSNTLCLEQFGQIIAPNAFTPNGRNPEFRPLVILTKIGAYKLVVFNRYGEKVFESNQLEQGWNGRKNGIGRPLPQGTYPYHIRVVQPNGRVIEKKGLVLLLR